MIHPTISSSSNQQNFSQLNAVSTVRKNSFGQQEDIYHNEEEAADQQQNYSLFQYNSELDIELLFPSHFGNQIDSEALSYRSASCSSSSSGLPCKSISNEQLFTDSNTHPYFYDLHQQEPLTDHTNHSEQQSQLQNNEIYQGGFPQQYEQTQHHPQINYYNCAADMNNYNYLTHPQSCYSSDADSRTFEVKLEQSSSETFSSLNYPEEETALERVLSCPQTLQISRNYYQILLDYERHQKEQELHNVSTKSEQKIPQQSQHIHLPNNEQDDLEPEIFKSNKKNVVKNIMSAFKNFIFDGNEHQLEQQRLLALYNSTKKGLNDDLHEMQAKFKRYISSKNFNHYTVKLLIQHTNYSPVFKYFLDGPVLEWVTQSKVADVSSHLVMIDYLKDCFKEINKIEILKRHEKKRAHYQ